MSTAFALAAALAPLAAPPMVNGPPGKGGAHLAVKLACKRYADAYQARDRAALRAAVSEDFGQVWDRVPQEIFLKLPRGKGTDTRVVGSTKQGNHARVDVAAEEGVLTFLLEGSGLSWRVDDVYVPLGRKGQKSSLRDTLAVTMTSRAFLRALPMVGGPTFSALTSKDFRLAIARIPADALTRVRDELPQFGDDKITAQTELEVGPARASMKIRLPSYDQAAFVLLHLVKEREWRVDDLHVALPSMVLPSFKKGLAAITTASSLASFLRDPAAIDPRHFACDGKLLTELLHLHTVKEKLPGGEDRAPVRLEMDADLTKLQVFYPKKVICLRLCNDEERYGKLCGLQIYENAAWQDVCQLLSLKRQVSTSVFGPLLTGNAGGSGGGSDGKPAAVAAP